ncbi:MAG: KEOPS complex subunit Cgi121 [Candidatus Bathyarchaeia archaeon]
MIAEVREYGLYVGVLTFRGVYIENPELLLRKLRGDFSGLNIQVLNARNIAGFKHILTSVLTALEAFNHKLNIAKNLSMEVLVRASTQRQISEALNVLGIKEGVFDVAFVAIDERRGKIEEIFNTLVKYYDNRVDELLLEEDRSGQIMEIYGISEEDVEAENEYSKGKWEAVKNLVAEKVALTLIL